MGKTTVSNIITGLSKPSSGKLNILNQNINTLTNSQKDIFRATHFGIIFQQFNLIPFLNVKENITLPCTFSKAKKEKVLQKNTTLNKEAIRLCNELDINSELQKKHIKQLSIGQQQRVAIDRALIGQPEIIIADEPTSALDTKRKTQFMELLFNECNKYNITLIFISHDHSLKKHFNKILDLNVAQTKQS